jgi:hypothetical protein
MEIRFTRKTVEAYAKANREGAKPNKDGTAYTF